MGDYGYIVTHLSIRTPYDGVCERDAHMSKTSRISLVSEKDLNEPGLYINRELSWLEFNARVLEEALDSGLPLYERIKFLGIFSSNLDEFFMVRVAGLKQQILGNVTETPADGMLPSEQLAGVSARCHELVDKQYRCWREEVLPALARHGVEILSAEDITAEQREVALQFFRDVVFPALTPLAVDPGHPFPHLKNKSINVAVMLAPDQPVVGRNVTESAFAVVQVPSVFSRLVELPLTAECEEGQDCKSFMLLGELIAMHADLLFPGYRVLETTVFRVTRNWDIEFDEEESEDLLSTIEEELRRRDRGAAVRMEINENCSDEMHGILREALNLELSDTYDIDGPLDLTDLMAIPKLVPNSALQLDIPAPVMPRAFRDCDSIFSVIEHQDVFLHHPYDSFEPVTRMVEEAADDPNVLAIKQTLYRTSPDGPIVRALSRAAENGKQVAALVELKARFDEERNIAWAKTLEENGVHVVYGVLGLKTHCKVTLIVRREGKGIRRYIHLGTGNYNPDTAKLYTDVSFFTCRQEIAEDVSALFNLLTGYSNAPNWKRLAVAPIDLHNKVLRRIKEQEELAHEGKPARIIGKMNSLVDPRVIRALYRASQAGVQIDLIVRGICCLRAGVPGVSENIRVVSIVDRFLEHSRVFVFGEGENQRFYGSSADWMPRNFQRRVEVMFPIEDPAARRRILEEVLGVCLQDNVKARVLQSDGSYKRVAGGEPRIQTQVVLSERAREHRVVSGALDDLVERPAPEGEPEQKAAGE